MASPNPKLRCHSPSLAGVPAQATQVVESIFQEPTESEGTEECALKRGEVSRQNLQTQTKGLQECTILQAILGD